MHKLAHTNKSYLCFKNVVTNYKFKHNAIKSGVNVKCKTNYGENIIYFNEVILNICVDVTCLIRQGGEEILRLISISRNNLLAHCP